jgi:hypothetical protein
MESRTAGGREAQLELSTTCKRVRSDELDLKPRMSPLLLILWRLSITPNVEQAGSF